MQRKEHIRNNMITIIVYLLIIYIIVLMCNPFFKKIAASDSIYMGMKYIADNNLPIVSYCNGKNKEHSEISLSVAGVMNHFIYTPTMKYVNDSKITSVTEEVNKSYLTKEYQSKEYIEKNHFYMDGDENTNECINDQNTQMLQKKTAEQETPAIENTPAANDIKSNNTGFGIKNKEITIEQLSYHFLMKNYYSVVSSTTLRPEDIDANKLMNVNLKMKQNNDAPQILIYHTHGQEAFADSDPNNRDSGVVGVGNYLTKLLTEKYGYNVIHLTDSFDYVNGVLDRSKAYDYAYNTVSQVLADNPSIEVVLDIHRDGVAENLRLVTNINGKQTAKIMFFNGISRLNSIGEIGYLFNPYRTENLAMSLQMKVLAEEYFEGFTRKTYIQAYQYNQHMRAKSMLIEVGAQTNTFEEAYNAMEPLALLLNEELK